MLYQDGPPTTPESAWTPPPPPKKKSYMALCIAIAAIAGLTVVGSIAVSGFTKNSSHPTPTVPTGTTADYSTDTTVDYSTDTTYDTSSSGDLTSFRADLKTTASDLGDLTTAATAGDVAGAHAACSRIQDDESQLRAHLDALPYAAQASTNEALDYLSTAMVDCLADDFAGMGTNLSLGTASLKDAVAFIKKG